MVTARKIQLLRTPDLRAFRRILISLAIDGDPLHTRDRLLIVPTRAAAELLRRSIENHVFQDGKTAVVLPDLITPRDLTARLAARTSVGATDQLSNAEREVLLGVACNTVEEEGIHPPFRLRSGLVGEILRFYDELRLNGRNTDAFERLAVGELEPAAEFDLGAARLLRQTRFLVAVFREFEWRSAGTGALDDHGVRARLLEVKPMRPWRHAVVAVADNARDAHGLAPVHWELLSRVTGLERLDVVVTETVLAGAFHEMIQQLLPGIEEVALPFEMPNGANNLDLAVPPGHDLVHVERDREDEVATFARRVRQLARDGVLGSLNRAALVVEQPLPYVYVAREVFRAAGIPMQTLDALPLAAEPYAAALDLVLSVVSTGFARGPSVELLRSPHLRFEASSELISGFDCAALDHALAKAGYLGGLEALEAVIARWRIEKRGSGQLALRAGEALLDVAITLTPLVKLASRADHLTRLLAFLKAHERLPGPDDPTRTRQLRGRGAVLGTLESLRGASTRFDSRSVAFDEVAAMVRRWLEEQTFSLRSGNSGVHLVDAESARFGDFDVVRLAGLVNAEWPQQPRRNIFYSSTVLRDLGWPAETDQLNGARSKFVDLLRLPAQEVSVSRFTLENDVLVAPSPFLDDVTSAGLEAIENKPDPTRVFEHEALGFEPVQLDLLDDPVRRWAAHRLVAPSADGSRFRGFTAPTRDRAYAVSALERYQDCPFKYFASHVLELDEPADDEPGLSPRVRGKFLHEVFQKFFEAWDATGQTAITTDRVDVARKLFAEVVEPLLARLPDADAVLERARLFGSAIAVGIVDTVLGLEAARPASIQERWLEYGLEGKFSLGVVNRQVMLKGVADRVDLLEGNRLRVIDYKSGSVPKPKRALQVPIYAMCAAERLGERDGRPWTVDEASYVAFSARRPLVSVVKPGKESGVALANARKMTLSVIDGISRGEFPPRPHDTVICTWCAYSTLCRKDYVSHE